jgi:hypothetical protein
VYVERKSQGAAYAQLQAMLYLRQKGENMAKSKREEPAENVDDVLALIAEMDAELRERVAKHGLTAKDKLLLAIMGGVKLEYEEKKRQQDQSDQS